MMTDRKKKGIGGLISVAIIGLFSVVKITMDTDPDWLINFQANILPIVEMICAYFGLSFIFNTEKK